MSALLNMWGIVLIMEAKHTAETSIIIFRLHCASTQKTAILRSQIKINNSISTIVSIHTQKFTKFVLF